MTNGLQKRLAGVSRAVFGIMVFMVLSGCGRSGTELVGIWDNAKAPEVLEFKKDGTGTFSYPQNQNPPLAFAWKQTARNSCTLTVDYLGNKRILTGTIKDKALSLESTAGREEYIKRATH